VEGHFAKRRAAAGQPQLARNRKAKS
jgi:hypothetical protein